MLTPRKAEVLGDEEAVDWSKDPPLSSQEFKRLLASLQGNTTLKSLKINGSQIGDEGSFLSSLPGSLYFAFLFQNRQFVHNTHQFEPLNQGAIELGRFLASNVNTTLATIKVASTLNYAVVDVADKKTSVGELSSYGLSEPYLIFPAGTFFAIFHGHRSACPFIPSIPTSPIPPTGERGAKYLANALRVNRTLKIFDISYHEFCSKNILPLRRLCNALASNHSLLSINISGCFRYTFPFPHIFHSGSLTSVSSSSKFGNEGASAIESSLQSNNSLTKLKIAENGTHLLLNNRVVKVCCVSISRYQERRSGGHS